MASGEHAGVEAQISPEAPTATPAAVAPQPTLTPLPEIAPSDEGFAGGAISAIVIARMVDLSIIGGITYSYIRRSKGWMEYRGPRQHRVAGLRSAT